MSEKKLVTEKKVVDIKSIFPNEHNPNTQSGYTYQKMKDTLQKKGLYGAACIVCRHPVAGHYIILDGEHRWRAMKELGYTEIPVEVCIEDMSDNDIKFWTVYFNNTRGRDDIMKRAKLLKEIDSGMAQLLPFTEEERANEINLHEFDFSQYEAKEEIEGQRKFQKLVHFKLSDEEYFVWNECLRIDKELKGKGRKPEQVFMLMLEEYMSRRLKPLDLPGGDN